MIRIEIIANQSVEENILGELHEGGLAKHYSQYNAVHGAGSSGPRLGDAVWPEENFCLVVWCAEEEARAILRVVSSIKERFPGEGIKFFSIPEIPAADQP
jgi:hypothetical protein